MQNPILRSTVLLAAVALSAGAFSSIARAQVGPMGSGGMLDPGVMMKQGAKEAPDMTKPAVVPPPALPGAASRADTVAPATRLPSEMSPNEALFDAINRGDVAAARDALSRGAELNARNVLGMTPMELSVDLGRNDISFLLLSYRGTDAPAGPPAHAKATAADTLAKATAKHTAREPVVRVKDVVPAAPQTPQLFANNGGTPVPSAGFLGFDAAHPSR